MWVWENMELEDGLGRKQTLLIIGAGFEQVEAYKLARAKGIIVVGTDMAEDAPAFSHADHKIIASTRDVDETVKAVKAFAARHPINGVMTIANDVPYTVARTAEALGLPGAAPDAVKSLTNKVDMKGGFLRAGVATPAFTAVRTFAELQAAIKSHGLPCILKPSDGRGARGVLYLDKTVDPGWAFTHSMGACGNGILLVEDYYAGDQFSVEGMFIDGKYHCVAYADRNYTNLPKTKPYIVEDGGTIPSYADPALQEKIRVLVEKGARSLGLDWGVVKGDIVLAPDGSPAIIELAGRLSGNYLATHHIPFTYGVDLVGAVMDLALGKTVDPSRLAPASRKYLGVRYFFPPAGMVRTIRGADEIRALPYVHEFMLFRSEGDTQPLISSHGARAGTIMVEGRNYEEATARAERVAAMLEFGIEVSGNNR